MPCWLKASKNVSGLWGIEKVQLERGKGYMTRVRKMKKREIFALPSLEF